MRDEYDLPELSDGVAVIAWLAAQPWCSGRVGMWEVVAVAVVAAVLVDELPCMVNPC